MEKEKKNRKKLWLIVGLSVLGLLLALLIAGLILGKSLLGMIGRIDPNETISQAEIDGILNETDPLDPNIPEMDENEIENPNGASGLVEDGDNILNIMLIGQDRRPGQGRQRSDSMILITINKEKKSLTMTSFMRDLWVKIPNKYYERLNVPYAIGGSALLDETMESVFGIKIDHNIEVDFFDFMDVIDTLGGVEVELTKTEKGYLNYYYNWALTTGNNLLNGEQALAYSRLRKVGTEFARTNRQRTVLTALFNKIKNSSVTQLYAVAEEILPLVKTDMTDAELMSYLLELSKLLPDVQVVSQRIPIDGAYKLTMIQKKSVIYLNEENMEKNLEYIRQTIGE